MPPALLLFLLPVVELPIALGVAFAVFEATFVAGCKLTTCVDVQGLPWVLVGLVAGIVIGLLFWLGAIRLKTRWRARLVLDAVAIVVAVLALAIPKVQEQRNAAANRASSAVARQRFEADRLRWIEALKAHDHGPVGVVPPMLDVDDDGSAVRVTNRGSAALQVAIARVRQDPTAPGGWAGCPLLTETKSGRYHRVWLAPHASETLHPDPRCGDEFGGATLEYRVGFDARDGVGWWTDSAFAAVDGRELPRAIFESDLKPPRRAPAASDPRPQRELLAPKR